MITMPSFGHGWRTENKIAIRRIFVQDEFLIAENLDGGDDLWNGASGLGSDESSGAVTALSDGSVLPTFFIRASTM